MFKRFRPHRINETTRLTHRETFLKAADFILPIFLVAGTNIKQEISSMPDTYHFSVDKLLIELDSLVTLGLGSILLFGIPDTKGIEQAYAENGIIQQAIPQIKNRYPDLEIITDVCLCSYSEDGHCHIGDNDESCKVLAKIAASHAAAGVDIVAPSDMMDGRIYFIKQALLKAGLTQTKILSYSAKYASNFYGPFRDAASCSPKSGDRKTYQMDYANSTEALEEIEADLDEGADQVMVKPALAYLDVISRANSKFKVPIAAYNVSGEYAMLKNAIKNGICNEDIINETLISIKRAGASRIVSYFTPYILQKLDQQYAK